MSSDEDFSLVTQSPQRSEDTLEGIKALITKYKKQYDQLMQEQKELAATRDDHRDLAQQFKGRSEKLAMDIKVDQQNYKQQIENEKEKLLLIKQEESSLIEEIQRVNAALVEEMATSQHLKEESDVFSAVPEKDFVFTGLTVGTADTQKFEMTSHIVYPMDGGTALVTFEEEDVAQNILLVKTHRIDLGEECHISLEAMPVQLMVPTLVEIDSKVCPQRILISNLPRMDIATMLDKLEIHFSKTKNGGGEVEDCEILPDSGTVVITFVEKHIAKNLTDKEYHEVILTPTKHRVRVTPFLNGNITNLKTKMSMCPRTVLLTGIPDVMERDILQDLLEIHFQKNSNGGGEIEAFLYNPLSEQTSAVFEGITPNTDEK